MGLVAVVGVVATLIQRNRADNRREWWMRFQWAMESTYSGDEGRRRDGWRILRTLVVSNIATKSEEDLILELAGEVLYVSQGTAQSASRLGQGANSE